MEFGQIEDRPRDEGEVAAQKADCDDGALAPAFRRDLAGRGAADHRRRAETPRNLRREGRDVVVRRDEDDEAGKVRGRELPGELRGRRVSPDAPRRRDDHPSPIAGEVQCAFLQAPQFGAD